jgi:methionyl aminopeptidase
MSVDTPEELAALRRAGRAVSATLREVARRVRPGVTTAELDAVAGEVFARHGARSAPRLVYGFPGHTCISVADEVVHGIPGGRRLRAGDVVKLDVTAEKDGYMADAARTVVIGEADERGRRLADCARRAFQQGLQAARPGNRVSAIGARVEAVVRAAGFRVIRELAGHGIGRTIHEAPTVPNFRDPAARARLERGAVITIEPIIAAGSGAVFLAADGWTVRTRDASSAAHHEHTVVVAAGRPIVVTAA